MSTTTKHFVSRRGALPFCASEALPPSSSSYDYVELASIDGDDGLTEAARLWWMLERVTFTPTGTVTYIPTGAAASFSPAFTAPNPTTSGIVGYRVQGIVVGNISSTSTSTSPVEPIMRPCHNGTGGTTRPGLILDAGMGYTIGTKYQEGDFTFYIAYVSGHWRLYYNFEFGFSDSPADGGITISNPASVSWTPKQTGTCSFMGVALDWEAYWSDWIWDPADHSVTGVGLTVSAGMWTF